MKINRRSFLSAAAASPAFASLAPSTRMTVQLSAGSIGVKANQLEAIDYAQRYGFDVVDADSGYLSGLSAEAISGLLESMRAKKVGWGSSGLSVEFRRGEEDFAAGMKALPARAAALRKAGVTRVGTWISPAHDSLTYLENLKQHARRLREVATVLGDHGCRFGLEYVGPKTSWTARRYAFVHSLKECRELIAEIGRPNVGLVLDSWHWYTAGETLADLKTLTNDGIVSIDLNDAPQGLAVDQQVDSRRELPCSTGVIDMAGFLNTLHQLGCDAPARCEPFNAALRSLAPELALQATVHSMRKAFALIR